MNRLDIFLLLFTALYVLITATTVGVMSKNTQDILIMVTHALAFPMIILLQKTQWILWVVIIGVVCSLLYHLCIIIDYGQEYTGPLDIAFANLTLLLVSTVIIFEKFPEWILSVIIFMVVLLSDFWQYDLVAQMFGGTIVIAQVAFVIKKVIDNDKKRNILFLGISLLIGFGGIAAFQIYPDHQDKYYAAVHSIWHVCSYVAMYFGLRSITAEYNRIPRVEFETEVSFGKLSVY